MATTAESREYTLVMEIDQWTTIDSCLNNEVEGLGEQGWGVADGEDEWPEGRDPHWTRLTDLASSVIAAGERQFSDRPEDYEDIKRWATSGEMRSVTLTGEQWRLVVNALAHSAEGSWDWEPDVPAKYRAVEALVRDQLAAQQFHPERLALREE